MNIFFAQATSPAGPSMNEIWIVLGGLAVLASIVGNIAQWSMSRRKRERVTLDQPIEVRETKEFAREKECFARHTDLKSRIAELERHRVQDAKDGAGSRRLLHDEIRKVRSEMGEMEGRLDNKSEERSNRLQNLFNEVLRELGRLSGLITSKK